jgi:rubredoxin
MKKLKMIYLIKLGRLMVEQWNQHELKRICPRCKSHHVAVAPKTKVNGSAVNITKGIKYTSYVCRNCNLMFDEAD